ncbi:MAG TPA: nucleotidyltransferase domain-containing protein [Candidatus Sulfotelmatobacter sp.]|jgi:predicted nucleotidyltransferase|nr:nucleotidyltransferase domain-containing protein [Candidatus Sulfotelmatobacter sp.]
MADLLQHVRESGFLFPDRLIHLFVGGSELHGAKVHGTDDLDIYGVYIEPPEMVLGLESLPHFVWSTAGNDRRNGPNDVDITLYSLRKWAELACKGNPTALHFLFAGGVLRNAIWAEVVENKSAFLARVCVKQFLGFADDQLKRMTGQKGRGKKGQRPEIEAKYGYDVKAAMHTLRLLYECKELVSQGTITLPRPERDFLIRVRTGKYSMEKVLAMAQILFSECEEAGKVSVLPERVDRTAVSKLLADSYRKAWAAG